jgi:CRISPR/Cas system-associated exonuclease Cas4 (RecB family)
MESYGVDAVPYESKMMDTWRDTFKGVETHHKPTNLIVFGGVDDVWQSNTKGKEGELIVVDYKATSKDSAVNLDAEWQGGYKRQMEVYQWLLRQNGFEVSNTGYFVYANGKRDREAFDGKLEFDVVIIPYTGSDEWIPDTLSDMKSCLESHSIPNSSRECEYCAYIDSVKSAV